MTLIAELSATIPTLTSCEPASGTDVHVAVIGAGVAELTLRSADGRPRLSLEVELGTGIAYWHADQGSSRTLPPDWTPPTSTSLVRSAPVGALYAADGEASFGWAADELVAELTVNFGVSEERKTVVVEVQPTHPLPGPLTVRLDFTGGPVAEVVGRLARWASARRPEPPLAVPPIARRPVYSTWYTFTQDIDEAVVESEAALAVEAGCGSVFIDDGWQRLGHGRGYAGCGDWTPDEEKFPDLPATIGRIRELGAGVALWIAPLLLGERSDAYAEVGRFAPQRVDQLDCFVLDPRYAEVRVHLAEVCLRLVAAYGADALKVDFLDNAMVYRGTESGGDIADVGEAMAALLQEIRERLAAAGRPDVAFEFRQPYVSPAISRYGQILRASDCPADAVVNRRETIDCRLLAVGQVVHADPLMWGPTGGAEAVAQQLYAGWFSVPQISMRLADLDPVQSAALRNLLGLWTRQREIVLDGALSVRGAEYGYDEVRSVHTEQRSAVVAVYTPRLVELDLATVAELTILNATGSARVLLDATRPVRGGVVRSAGGEEVGSVAEHAAGIVALDVPAFGSVMLTLD